MTQLAAQLISLAFCLALLLLAGWWGGTLAGPARQRRAAERFVRRSGLPAEAVPGLVRRVVRRQRWTLAGIAAGLVVATWLDELWFAALYIGLAVGAVADRLTQPDPAPDAPRVAHATGTRVTDYVPGWLLVVVSGAAAVVPLLAALWAVAPRTDREDYRAMPAATVLALVTVTLLALGASLWLARVIVHRRGTVGSPLELASDDALRAQAVRDALHLTAAVSVIAAFALGLALKEPDVDGALRRVGGWLPVATLVLLVVVGVVHEWTGLRHWRRRLHPELEREPVRA